MVGRAIGLLVKACVLLHRLFAILKELHKTTLKITLWTDKVWSE